MAGSRRSSRTKSYQQYYHKRAIARYRWPMLALLPPEIRAHRTPDGLILASPIAPGQPARAVGDWLVRWARDRPAQPFLAERDAAGAWQTLTYRDALAAVTGIASGL